MNTQKISIKVICRKNLYAGVAIAGALITCITMTGCQREIIVSSSTKLEANVSNYADDRALIEDLQARYMFALDFGDIEKYLATFTEDGVLDIGEGEWRGHEEIRKVITAMPKPEDPQTNADSSKIYPPAGRHCIANIVVKIEDNKAFGRAYWFHMANNNMQRSPTVDCYGHYEDEMVKVNGMWLFSKRRIFNEQNSRWIAPAGNPSW